jgi:hypothetical protein
MAAYCFGDLPPSERELFELHLLDCDYCSEAVQRLSRATHVLRTDPGMKQTLLAADVIGVLGMSGGLDRPFAGHAWFVAPIALAYASLYSVACAVEAGYTLGEQAAHIGRLMIVALPAMLAVTLLTFLMVVRRARSGQASIVAAIAVHLAGTLLVCLYVVPHLPAVATVPATFQTYTAQAGYLKSVIYFCVLLLPFTLAPFQAVTSLQNELRRGHAGQVLALMIGDRRAVLPRGMLFPRVRVLGWLLLLIAGKAVIDIHYLFGSLLPDEQMNLFMFLVLVRVVVWFGIAIVALLWYARSLNELKREALAVQSFLHGSPRRTALRKT